MCGVLAEGEYIACDLPTTEAVGRRPAVRGQMSPSHAQPSFYYKMLLLLQSYGFTVCLGRPPGRNDCRRRRGT